jgi:hypothetical protein
MMHVLLTVLMALTLGAADATGTWTGTLEIPDGDGKPRPAHLVLKQDGTKLTGTAGPDANDQRPIQNGKAENGTVTFEVANEGNVISIALKQDGDTLAGEMSRERDGQKQTAKMNLQRAK